MNIALPFMRALVLLCVYQHTKFEVCSFTNSKDIIEAKFKKWVMSCSTTTNNTITLCLNQRDSVILKPLFCSISLSDSDVDRSQ